MDIRDKTMDALKSVMNAKFGALLQVNPRGRTLQELVVIGISIDAMNLFPEYYGGVDYTYERHPVYVDVVSKMKSMSEDERNRANKMINFIRYHLKSYFEMEERPTEMTIDYHNMGFSVYQNELKLKAQKCNSNSINYMANVMIIPILIECFIERKFILIQFKSTNLGLKDIIFTRK